jgi:hypothetical protein
MQISCQLHAPASFPRERTPVPTQQETEGTSEQISTSWSRHDTTLSWEGHINKIIPKLNSACFVLPTVKLFSSIEELKIVYFDYVHSVISHGVIFCENASSSKNVFLAEKRIIRNIFGGTLSLILIVSIQ